MKKQILFFLFILLVSASAAAQTIRYVKEGGTGNGSSWAVASGDLQAIINASTSGDQVWVAAGTYTHDNGDGNSFLMKEGVQVFGGFPNSGNPTMVDRTLPTVQNATNLTILDGQYARRVLLQQGDFTTATVWDGFVIQLGDRRGDQGNADGAGAYLRNNGELMNCVIQNNRILGL